MKVALVVPGGVDRSGEVRVVPALLALIKRLAANHEVHVYAMRQEPKPADWPLLGAQVHNIGGRSSRLGLLRAVLAIRSEHRKAPFDLVQAIWSGFGGLVAVLAAKMLGLPSAIHLAGGELVTLQSIEYGGRLSWRGRLREALVLRGASRLTAASQPMLDQIAALGFAAQRIPLGVDLDTWPARAPQAREPHAPLRLVHVASINRVKDPFTLLHAMEMLQRLELDFHLDIVGEDTLDGQIHKLARRLGVAEKIRFHGFMTRPQAWGVVSEAHVHLVSSLHEAGPLALLEAAIAGVPSIGTRVGHLAEWEGDAALVVEVGDARAMALAIQRLGQDEALRLRLAHAAQRRALREDADHSAALMEAMWIELVGR